MHTIIRAISYCVGCVAGLFRRADAPQIRYADNDKAMAAYRAVSGNLEASRRLLADDFGDAHDQVARGDG